MEQDTEKLRDIKDLKYKGYLLTDITKEWCEEEEALMYFFKLTRLSDNFWIFDHIHGSNKNELKGHIRDIVNGELEPFYYQDKDMEDKKLKRVNKK